MYKLGVIAGEANEVLGLQIEEMGEYSVGYESEGLEGLKEDLKGEKRSGIEELESIIILDYGFKGNKEGIDETGVEEFISIQGLMGTYNMNTKLYLVTRDKKLYNNLRDNIKGTQYHNVQIIMLKREEYPVTTLVGILNGEWDDRFLFNNGEELEDKKEWEQDRKGKKEDKKSEERK